jgi:hypothetical protein
MKEPKGLPPVKQGPATASRRTHCHKCGSALRIVSNYLGVNAHCAKCKEVFPVASTAKRVEPVLSLPRGLRKRTMVEPDWGKAFEDIGGSNDDQS